MREQAKTKRAAAALLQAKVTEVQTQRSNDGSPATSDT